MVNFDRTFANLLRARFPLIYIPTWEEERALRAIRTVAANEALVKTPRRVVVWSCISADGASGRPGSDPARGTSPNDFIEHALSGLQAVERINEPSVFVFKDLHFVFGGQGRHAEPHIIRRIRDLAPMLKESARPKNVVFLSPMLVLPDELQKDVTILDFELPGFDEINRMLADLIRTNRSSGRIQINLKPGDQERLAKAALGLTLLEAENAFARAMVEENRLDISGIPVILEEKRQIIKKSETLEFIQTDIDMSEVGGLENLKRWLRKRDKSWLESARRYAIPAPRGLLITGVPGCGKSLIAKAICATWQLPLLRLDVGKIFSGLVGSSEENIRRAISTAEALAPAVLWIDEVEKGFSGVNSIGDSGTATRVFGTFLTWMQEKTKPVFVVATANQVEALPSEFMRKGRFDEIFFVDLPTYRERLEIFRVHMGKRLKNPSVVGNLVLDDRLYERLAHTSEGFSGAEIEQVVIAGLFEAFSEDRSVSAQDFERALRNTVPLSVTQAEQILRIRSWANLRAVAASAAKDLAGYGQIGTEQSTAAVPAVEPDVRDKRGGRVVDV